MTSPNTKKPKIHVETTLFNYYFDKDRDILHTNTVELFRQIAAGKYEAYTSDAVIRELELAPEPKRGKMPDLIPEYRITVLKPNDAAERLADIYIAEGIIPPTHREDGLHIARVQLDLFNKHGISFVFFTNRSGRIVLDLPALWIETPEACDVNNRLEGERPREPRGTGGQPPLSHTAPAGAGLNG